jgi:hypothetical protein
MTQHFQPGVLDLSREAIQQSYSIPEIPLEIPPPGFYRADLLQWSYKGLLPSGRKPWDRPRCLGIRAEQGDRFLSWASDNYTWDQFLGEVNWISDDVALTLLEMMLERDILHKMLRGILRENSVEHTPRSRRLPELERMLAWIRVGNRWAWWIDALQEIPDPKFHPIPRLDFSMQGLSSGVDQVRRHIESVSRVLFHRGIGNEGLLVMADYILYALGFLSEPPDSVPIEAFKDLVVSFDLDLLLRWPSSHFDIHLSESKVGRQAAFFSTPMNVSVFMSEMVNAALNEDEASDSEESVLQRKRKLCTTLGEPAAGIGNLILASSNHHWLGGPFWDINPSIKKVGRAQLALYAPWFTQYYFLTPPPYGSLAAPEELRRHAAEQQRTYIIERQRAVYAMEDWFLRFVGRAFSSPDASEQIAQCEKESRLLAKHIRHRAQARSTRKMRDRLRLFNSLLRPIRTETADADSGAELQDRKQVADRGLDRLNLAFQQEFLFDRAVFKGKE